MHTTNSPVKRKRDTPSAQTSSITNVLQLREYIQNELAGAVFKSHPDFVEKIFPIEEAIIESIYSHMVEDGSYAKNAVPTAGDQASTQADCGFWNDIPMNVNSENQLYPGFVKVANAISERCTSPHMSIRWIDSHSTAPTTSVFPTNQLKPDITALALPDNPKTDPTLEDGEERKIPLWWRRVLVPMEVKKKNSPDPAIIQLMSYIRLVLREQADRRFTFGFVLALQNLTVYVADRSGALCSAPINIHQMPKTFIRIMASLSLLPPSRLGWDTTMKILKNPEASVDELDYEYSWRTGEFESPGIGRAYDEAWVVEMPIFADGGKERRVKFVLFEALSLLRAGVIRGRGTRIWKAWRMDDMYLDRAKRHVYVYKDTWKDDRRETEGNLFQSIGDCEGVATMVSHEIVHVDGEVDNTLTWVRRCAKHKGNPLDLVKLPNQTRMPECREAFDTPTYIRWGDDIHTMGVAASPRGRTHARLVLRDFGWPLRRFMSLLELSRVLKDCVIGLKNMYEAGVLHRDVSQGNLIIVQGLRNTTPLNASQQHTPLKTCGQVIDLDYAKSTKDINVITDEARSCTWPFVSYEVVFSKPMFPPVSRLDRRPVVHGHQHDLESLFWVICWLAVCRGGPGTQRTILQGDTLDQHEDPITVRDTGLLCNMVRDTFDDDDGTKVVTKKKAYFNNRNEFSTEVLDYIAPYLSPLRPLIESLYHTLRIAYETQMFDGLHEKFIKELTALETKLENDPHGLLLRDAPHETTAAFKNMVLDMFTKEVKRRTRFWGGWDLDMEPSWKDVAEDAIPDENVRETKKRKVSLE